MSTRFDDSGVAGRLLRRLRKRAIDGKNAERRGFWRRALVRNRRDVRRKGRYRFDQARVTFAWLWLLTECRRRGWKGGINGQRGGLRTYAMQAALYALFLSGRGAPAFPPNGPSRHLIRNVGVDGWKQAVDGSEIDELIRIAGELGVRLHRPYAHEPWHVEALEPFDAPETWSPA